MLCIYCAIVFSCTLFSNLLIESCILFSCDLNWFLDNPVTSRMIFNALHKKRGEIDATLDLPNNYLIN